MHPLSPHVGVMSMIDIDASAFIQLGIVLLTFLILRSLVFAPLLQSMGARAARTEQARHEAQSLSSRARALAEKFEAEMLGARTRAAAAKADLRSQGMRHKEQVQAEARAAMGRKLNEVRDHVAAETENARREMKPQVESLSLAIAGKILGRNI